MGRPTRQAEQKRGHFYRCKVQVNISRHGEHVITCEALCWARQMVEHLVEFHGYPPGPMSEAELEKVFVKVNDREEREPYDGTVDRRERTAEARKNGLCVICLKVEASPNSPNCEACKEHARQRHARWRKAQR